MENKYTCHSICTSSFCFEISLAVQYRGKFLYEEFIEKGAFDPRQNESKIEMEESFLLKNSNRFDATFRASSTLRRYESRCQLNESSAECNEDRPSGKYCKLLAVLKKHTYLKCTVTGNYLMLTLRELLISITLHLYKFSRNYRYVHEILSKEKKMLKQKGCGCVRLHLNNENLEWNPQIISFYFAVKVQLLMNEPIFLHINIQF